MKMIAALLAALLVVALIPPPGRLSGAAAATTRPVAGVAYGRHPMQRMDIPRGTGRHRPGVFLIHGGWWSSGDKASLAGAARTFAAAGFAVFNVNYRTTSVAVWPAQRDDVAAAIRYARARPHLFGFDPGRYVLVGFSAGGHLATSVGTWPGRPAGLRGVVGFSPIASPLAAYKAGGKAGASALQRRLRGAAVRLAGCEPKACPAVWAGMEPAGEASCGDPPLLVFHSRNEFAPAGLSRDLAERLRRAGVHATVRVMPGGGHSTALYRLPTVQQAAAGWISRHLR